MSPLESLARALCVADSQDPEDLVFPLRMTRWWFMAQHILDNPAPVLDALAIATTTKENA